MDHRKNNRQLFRAIKNNIKLNVNNLYFKRFRHIDNNIEYLFTYFGFVDRIVYHCDYEIDQSKLGLDFKNSLTEYFNLAIESEDNNRILRSAVIVHNNISRLQVLESKNTDVNCHYIAEELTYKPYAFSTLHDIKFHNECYNIFNTIIKIMYTHSFTKRNRILLQKVNKIFDLFLSKIGLVKSGYLSIIGLKLLIHHKIWVIIDALIRHKQIRYIPNKSLADIMSHIIYSILYSSPTVYSSLNAALVIMNYQLYCNFSYYNQTRCLGESPATYACCLSIILSKLVGYRSLDATEQLIHSLEILDKECSKN